MNINCTFATMENVGGRGSRRGMVDDSFGPVNIWVKLVGCSDVQVVIWENICLDCVNGGGFIDVGLA